MEDNHLRGLWLRVDGCYNGPVWVVVETSANDTMYFTRGFRVRSLGQGHLLHFRLVGSDTLFVKCFRASGARLECCAESSSSNDSDSSSESEDDESSPSVKIKDCDSD